MKKVGKNKKETTNINKKTLLFTSLGITVLVIAVASLVIFRVAAKEKESQKAPCYYTIEEVFDYIRNDLFTTKNTMYYPQEELEKLNKQEKEAREKQARMGYVITHFYECFDKSNKFLIPTKMKDPFSKPEELEYISYDEYMELIKGYEIYMTEERKKTHGDSVYYQAAIRFLNDYALLKE